MWPRTIRLKIRRLTLLFLWSSGLRDNVFVLGLMMAPAALCCGRRRALSPNVGLKITRSLDVWLARDVSLGRLRSEYIAHNLLHMHSYIKWLPVSTACQLFSSSIKSEKMSMLERHWQKEINSYTAVFLCAVPEATNKKFPSTSLPEFSFLFTYWLQMSFIWNDNLRNTHMASSETPTFGLSACH